MLRLEVMYCMDYGHSDLLPWEGIGCGLVYYVITVYFRFLPSETNGYLYSRHQKFNNDDDPKKTLWMGGGMNNHYELLLEREAKEKRLFCVASLCFSFYEVSKTCTSRCLVLLAGLPVSSSLCRFLFIYLLINPKLNKVLNFGLHSSLCTLSTAWTRTALWGLTTLITSPTRSSCRSIWLCSPKGRSSGQNCCRAKAASRGI